MWVPVPVMRCPVPVLVICAFGYQHIFRFRSYLVTDIGRMLVAKGEVMNFCEAYWTWWANALVKESPRDCTVVIEGVGAR